MRIWHENYTLEHVITLRDNNINKHLGIKFTDISGHRVPTIFAKNMDDLAFRIYVVACNELSEF